MSFRPGRGQDNHLFAPIAARDATRNAAQASDLPFSDDENDDGHDSADDKDLLELTQGVPLQVSEAMVIEVGLHCF
jgi:hypothetical protein